MHIKQSPVLNERESKSPARADDKTGSSIEVLWREHTVTGHKKQKILLSSKTRRCWLNPCKQLRWSWLNLNFKKEQFQLWMHRAPVAAATQHIRYVAIVNYCALDKLSAGKATFSPSIRRKKNTGTGEVKLPNRILYVGHCNTLSGPRRMRSGMPAGTHRAYLGTQKRRKNKSQRSFILYESLNAATVDKEQSPRFH